MTLGILIWSTTSSSRAQTPAPDYSNVDDILNGRRTLVQIDDLVVSFYASATKTSYTNLVTSSNSVLSEVYHEDKPGTTVKLLSGRMFNAASSTPVIVFQDRDSGRLNVRVNFVAGITQIDFPVYRGEPLAAIAADFNNDGYDDVAISCNGHFAVGTAQDVNVLTGLFTFGPTSELDAIQEMVAGDFNGDGQTEIAGLSGLPSGDLALTIYTVDPHTLAVAKAAQITIPRPSDGTPVDSMSIAKGRFTPSAHDQLVVASVKVAVSPGLTLVLEALTTIDFSNSSLQPQLKSTLQTGRFLSLLSGVEPVVVKVKTGKFDFPNDADQIVFMFGWQSATTEDRGTKYLDLITVDPDTLTMTRHDQLHQRLDFSPVGCVYDMVVGNFDRRQPDPSKPGQTEHNPSQQVALLWGSCEDDGGRYVVVADVDPATFTWSYPSSATLIAFSAYKDHYMMVASDTQGRSYSLGAPTKLTVEGAVQPTVMLASPPMHVDYVPLAGEANPKLLNVSFIPDGFSSAYDIKETSSNQSSTKNTTGMTFGAKVTSKSSIGLDIPNIASSSIGINTKTALNLKNKVDTEHGTQKTYAFNASQETGLSDQVWYSESRANLYVYDVIGQTVCPADKPDCPDNEKLPLTLNFSGPDRTIYQTVSAEVLEWYQPPWEYGNILSYPGSYSQLQKIVPDIDKLSKDLTWFTDSSNLTLKTSWSSTSTGSQTTDSTGNWSAEVDVSAQAKTPVSKVSAELNLSGSRAWGTMTKTVNKLGESTGIKVNKTGTFLDPANYGYFVTPYIFGKTKPFGTVDDPSKPDPGDVETFEFVRTAFVVDPTRNEAGGWWKQTYGRVPDVALNHPSRWLLNTPGVTQPVPENCRPITGTGSQMDCVTLAPSIPNNPWVSLFHLMRGFFITSADNPGVGPQLGSATAGKQLLLQARVYNYSLRSMAPGTVVKVRFYAQPWNSETQMPAGDSVLIGEDKLSPIPPFSSDDGAPLNWVLAKTPFDTTPYANKDLTFWVVVWMEDGSGKMLPELEGHGLTSIPGTLKSLAGVQVEPFSNNVGFYKYVFHIFPSVSPSLTLAAPASSGPVTTGINIGKVALSASRMALGQMIEVSALLYTAHAEGSATTAIFYDGDPRNGGTVFDVERISHVGDGQNHLVKALYRPKTCGVHELFVVVNSGTKQEVIRRAAPLRVACDAVPGLAAR